MRKNKKTIALALAALMAASAAAMTGCGEKADSYTNDITTTTAKDSKTTESGTTTVSDSTTDKKRTELSIMLPYGDHSYDELEQTVEFRKILEDYTNTNITWELYDSTAYYEKLTLKYASGELAHIMVTSKNAEFLSACQYNTFWDVSDYLDLFDNLATIPEATRANASNNGKIYGIPRHRPLGRNACAYRQDWADALGLGELNTIDDLYNMAVAFTNGDPDGNGKNDTYGFGLDKWSGQWDIMFPWFGVHNVWGIDENGNLEYYAMQEEFKTALKTFRQWNSEGLINEGWENLKAGGADKNLLRTNMAGISIQVADTARKAQEAMNGSDENPGTYPDARFTYFGAVDGGYGYRVQPTDGFSGYVAISKALSPTEDDLMKALQFLNDLNDAEMRNLIDWGLEGQDYYIDANGYGVRYTSDEKVAMGISDAAYREGYNQMVPYFSTAEETAKLVSAEVTSDIKKAEAAIKEENVQYCVPNYGAGYTSATYVAKGADLDAMIEQVILDFILGNIDETGLDVQLETWLQAGGQAYIDEMNAAYKAAGN